MKKYLLTALLGVFGLFTAFASAGRESNCEISQCVISSHTPEFEGDYDYKIGGGLHDHIDFRLTYSPSSASIYLSDGSIECSDGLCSVDNLYDFGDENNDLGLFSDGATITSCVFVSSQNECTLTWVADSSDSSDSSGLLSGGTAVFGGIISSLGSAVSEFIPYVAFIGLGLLGAIIGFVAIKRLINRVRAKIFGTFNSRRRK